MTLPSQEKRLFHSVKCWLFLNFKACLITITVGAGGLIFDFMTPLGVAAGVIYVLFVLSAFGFRERYTAFLFAAIATIFTLKGYFFISEIKASSIWVVQLNRGLSILALWVVALVVYYQKMSERRILEESEKVKAVTDTVLDGLITIDSQGLIRGYNPAASRIFGYEPDEVMGQNVNILMSEPNHSKHDGYLSNYLNKGSKKIIGIAREVEARRKNGAVFPMEIAVSEMNLENKRMFVGSIRDITERKEAEAAIADYLEKLKRSNQELDDFAYIASHDLKEPLRGLSNNALFLEEDYEDILDEGGKRRLHRINFLCKRMETLVDDLLYYSRLGRQDLAIQQSDLNALIKDIALMMETSLKEANAEVVIPKPLPTITCDAPRIAEVFRNLITNAVKYNDKEQKIIEVGCANMDVPDTQDRHITFYVKDNGIGIDNVFYDDVFRIFKRLNSEEDDVKGTGVGLTFVKKIIERHGGKIWLDSELGVGTTFYFNLNLREMK